MPWLYHATPLYGSETCTLRRRHRSKSHAIEMTHLRRVEGTTRIDRVASEDIRRRLRVEIVLEVADRKKKEWRKKIEEMPQER